MWRLMFVAEDGIHQIGELGRGLDGVRRQALRHLTGAVGSVLPPGGIEWDEVEPGMHRGIIAPQYESWAPRGWYLAENLTRAPSVGADRTPAERTTL